MPTVEAAPSGSRIVSPGEWLAARRELLKKEKELTRLRDRLSAERRALPRVKVEKSYIFDTPEGKLTLGALFAGRSQLIVYHFMFGPEWTEGCHGCSFLSDGIDGATVHLAARDVTLVAVSRAPLAKIEAFKQRMGWHFPWLSSFGNDFNRDYHVSFTKEELARGDAEYNFVTKGFDSDEAPGASVFLQDGRGDIFHTYSTYARGLEPFIMAYHYLDIAPKGRDEQDLQSTMAWVRHHDRYGPEATVGLKGRTASAEGCPACSAEAKEHS
jgi:predicted dithiol-disulfide oxidoreductase (DUF899 family)